MDCARLAAASQQNSKLEATPVLPTLGSWAPGRGNACKLGLTGGGSLRAGGCLKRGSGRWVRMACDLQNKEADLTSRVQTVGWRL